MCGGLLNGGAYIQGEYKQKKNVSVCDMKLYTLISRFLAFLEV